MADQSSDRLSRHPALPYILPFGAFLGFLALRGILPIPETADFAIRVSVLALVLWFVSRPVIDLRLRVPWGTIAVGVGIFLLWIIPDVVFPDYRHHWLFENALMGKVASSLSGKGQSDAVVLALRFTRAVAIVPIVEELFWRAWLMRWLISADFAAVKLGTYTRLSFWVVALLFASEHGPYWDVGLAAGVLFNWWMLRTKSLGDLIWAHAIANGCLSAYVLITHRWEYWL